ncbi:hypothetical protein KI387_014533 [Taxus chinensis]|uniref:Methyltransferase type 11 domain-containing protein n=1 Tax=Taxus chinensis TaxID=29808 RepID=A0AA38FHX8_TAXCH|nr:hypothetical protein KI387_014533 [Taxus chinensis]
MDNDQEFPTAQLFGSVAKEYARTRPGYPPQLFSLLSSLTPHHELAWDVGTGNGQAALQIAEHYKKVVATDTSEQQLHLAQPRPNITYAVTPPSIPEHLLNSIVGPDSSVDLVTVATAVHWFDLDKFYPQVKRVLKKPGGVIAVWGYSKPSVNLAVDAVCERFSERVLPCHHPAIKWLVEKYESLPFPFAEVQSIRMEIEEEKTFEQFLGLVKTSSSKVVREGLLSEEFIRELEAAWGAPRHVTRTLKFPLFGKIGKA